MELDVQEVPGYLYAVTVDRLARLAGRTLDRALVAAYERVGVVVRKRLAAHEALEGLDEEAAAAAAGGDAGAAGLSGDTQAELVLALKRAVRNDPGFGEELASALKAVESARAAGGVNSTGGGTTAGGDVNNIASGPGSVAAGGNITQTSSGDHSPNIIGGTGINAGEPPAAPSTGGDGVGDGGDPPLPGPTRS